ncbi:DUF817 domain-containing protein [Kordiimonas lipolytica]|uniref:DUF817 domain-containing protein n=1 Tax=Kordiimonas lipolytica TaxID=1662421 RepID=A0ABV8UBA2_9PROT|nr:DUF817 domain-containing protein [Kordiimonas lipolytica]
MRDALAELGWFGLMQARACLFGALLIVLILLTRWLWPENAPLARYDFLFLAALLIQVIMLRFRLETWEEAKVILVFHIVGTAMELYKTSTGSWMYPEENLIRIAGVPLFSGFMYASVGSYFARVWRLFDFRFTGYPPTWVTVVLSAVIYINFFTHQHFFDLRYMLFVAVMLIFGRTWVYFTSASGVRRRLPLMFALVCIATVIWGAENFSTFGRVWVYPHQVNEWDFVHASKLGSWFLLMIISGVLVSLVQRPKAEVRLEVRERDT